MIQVTDGRAVILFLRRQEGMGSGAQKVDWPYDGSMES